MEETESIREYVILSYVIMECVSELKRMEDRPHMTLKSVVIGIAKDFGRRVRDRQQEVKRQLATKRLYPKIIDDGGAMVYVEIARPGQSKLHMRVDRLKLNEAVQAKMDELGEKWSQVEIKVPEAYTPVIERGDPYTGYTGR